MRICLSRIICCMLMLACATAGAQQYPSKPINLVVPFPAGSGSDAAARIIANQLGNVLGQPVVVQNRPGANTAIGAAAVAAAPPDGHTLLLATASTVALPSLNKSPPLDIRKDLTPISYLTDFVLYLYVSAELPVRTFPEFIAYAKAHPGRLTYATGNATGIVSSVQLISMTGIDMVGVGYKGEPPAVTDLVSNRIQVMFASPTSADAFVKQGKLRVLATTLPKRSPFLPDVPSITEFLPKFGTWGWGALMGPANMPRPVVERLAREVNGVLQKPEVKKGLAAMQMIPHGSTPDQFAAFFKDQAELYSRVLREAGVQPD